ncbi:MAG: thiamine pyrophosphate-dependent enzyme [Acidobacteriota bacterium]|nr:thiamine pyrophosphate-dependent enzyme [Acidobacteriota bacterium]
MLLDRISTEPFTIGSNGRPVIPLDPVAVYRYGRLIRSTETLLLDQFSRGLLSGTTHTCLGQELCAMSVVRALQSPDDAVFSNHRNHGHFLTYSGQFVGLVAEIMGRHAGVCGGVGGSQHLAWRNFHSNGVQGGMTAIGVGQALARQKRKSDGVVAIFVGDGTLGEGLLYESLNLASIWKVPALFVVENNRIAQTTATTETIGGSIEDRGSAFGLATWHLDDSQSDFLEQAQAIVKGVRTSQRPGFLVIDTMRLGPHSKGDDLRDPAEMAEIRKRDPLENLGRSIAAFDRERCDEECAEFVESVRLAAEASPPASSAEPKRHFFIHPAQGLPESASPKDANNVRSDINRALTELLEQNPNVLLLGEDLHDPYGGAFKVSAGLSAQYAGRVISTPISEAGIVGSAIGLALAGFRPIVEIMFADFVTLAMDQIYNHAVKFPGMFPDARVPLIIRTPSGGRRGYGPTHSQSVENLLSVVPGLTVVFPTHRHGAGELLSRAVNFWPYPTAFIEHKLVYGLASIRGKYTELPASPEDPAAHLFPTLITGESDPDLTIVAIGHMLSIAEDAVCELRNEELAIEIISPSLLSPLPAETLWRAVEKRSRVIVAEEAHAERGFGSELAAILIARRWKGRLLRVGTPPFPIPAARSLEAQFMPGSAEIVKAALELILN